MRSASLLFVLGLLACPSMAALAKTQGPSSQIPDRREFPVNDQINPCQDFYQYACSKVIKNFKLRDDRSDHTFAFDDSAERLLEKKKTFLRKIAHAPAKSSSLSPRTQTLATIYNSCMDSDARRLEEKQRVSQTLSKLASIKDKAEFSQFLADERQAARTSLYEIGNIADQDQPASYNFYFSVNAMSLPERSYYENAEVQRDFKKVLSSFYQTLGQKNATATAQTVLDFESAFAKVYPKPAEWREIMVEKREISRDDLIQRYPSFRMAETLKQVPQTTKIRHLIPESFAFLQDHLTHDSLDTLKAVYLFQSLAPLLDDAYPAFEKSYRAFRIKHLGESKLRPDRQERCTMLVMDKFTKELDAELLPEIFPSFPEEKFIALAEDIRKSIINGIQSNQWL
ncbi:MAG: hypothetical protein NTX25_20355, partial [Proteobacteria bacterium]|nr:hypothetical protein [Pseudomonadota bacterium]